MYWIWLPVGAHGHFQPSAGVFKHFNNGINYGDKKQASDGYTWVVSTLFVCFQFLSLPVGMFGPPLTLPLNREHGSFSGMHSSTHHAVSTHHVLYGCANTLCSYDASAHLAEETNEASSVVAKGMWMATLSGWVLSVPTLILILFCIQDFDAIVAGGCFSKQQLPYTPS